MNLSSHAFRCLVAVSALAVYGVGASWFVRTEGRSYRESIRSKSGSPESGLPTPAVSLATEVGNPPRSEPKTDGSLALDDHSTRQMEEETRKIEEPADGRRAEEVNTKQAEAKESQTQESATEANPEAGNVDPIWTRPSMKKAWDPRTLTDQDEIEIGQNLYDLILSLNPPVQGGTWKKRLQDASDALRKTPGLKNSPYNYRFTVLDSDAYNAFSHPGGYIYVSRKLIDSFGKDETYGLEFLIAHEMAHVELHHALLCLQAEDMQNLSRVQKLGTIEMLYGIVIPLAYTDEMEFAADDWARERMWELGRGRREALDFLRKLKKRSEVEDFAEGKLPPIAGTNPIDNHMRAHVSAGTRLDRAGDPKFWDAHQAPIR